MNFRHTIVVLILGNWRLASSRGGKLRAGMRLADGESIL
jgi:hypothetical protein